jgi:hypothetical protein
MTTTYKPEHEARQSAIRSWQVYCRSGVPGLNIISKLVSAMTLTWSVDRSTGRIRFVLPSGAAHSTDRTQEGK